MTAAVLAPVSAVPATMQEQSDLAARYIAWLDSSALTVRAHKHALTVWGRYLEDNGISAPARADVLTYREHLVQNYAAGTARSYLTAVKMLYRFAASEGLYADIADVRGVHVTPHQSRDALTVDQARAVLAQVRGGVDDERGRRDYAMTALMLSCGLRCCEVVRADMRHYRQMGGQMVLYVQGKGHVEADDFVRVPAAVDAAIRRYLAARGPVEEDEPLFAGTCNRNRGGRLTTRTVSGVVKAAFRACGLDSSRYTAHSLRHTAVTLALLGGVSLQEASQFARHAHLSTTQIYAHNLERAANRGADTVAGQVF